MKITSTKQSSFFSCFRRSNKKVSINTSNSNNNDSKTVVNGTWWWALKILFIYPMQLAALVLGFYGIFIWTHIIATSNNDDSIDYNTNKLNSRSVIGSSTTEHYPNVYGTDSNYVDYFANNGYAKAFDTMQYPMGLYHPPPIDTTFICYQGPHEDPYIVSYHHTNNKWDGPYQIGTSQLGHNGGDPIQMHDGKIFAKTKSVYNKKTKTWENERKFQADNHGKPSIVIDTNGYIHISYGAHGGYESLRDTLGKNHYGDYSAGRQYHMKSNKPYDITSGFSIQNDGVSPYNGGAQRFRFYQKKKNKTNNGFKHSRLSWNGCYAQFVQVPIIGSSSNNNNNKKSSKNNNNNESSSSTMAIYHFVRHGAHASCWTYQVSINNGKTFGPPIPFVKTKQQEKTNVKDSWYCRFRGGSDSSKVGYKDYSHIISAVCVYHNHVMPPGLHTLESYNAYYMYLDTTVGKWYNVHDEEIMSFSQPQDDHYDITVDSVYTKGGAFPDPKKYLAIMEMDTVGLTKEKLDAKAIVVNTESSSTAFPYQYIHPGSVAIDEDGNPHILLKIATNGETNTSSIGRGQKRLFYTKWTGSMWTDPVAVTSTFNNTNTNVINESSANIDEDGDMILHNSQSIDILLPINNVTHADIVSFHTNDGGISWHIGTVLYSTTGIGKLKTSALVRNHHPNGQLLAYNIGTKGNPYRSLYLIGSNGTIKRTKDAANTCTMKRIQRGTDVAATCVLTKTKQ